MFQLQLNSWCILLWHWEMEWIVSYLLCILALYLSSRLLVVSCCYYSWFGQIFVEDRLEQVLYCSIKIQEQGATPDPVQILGWFGGKMRDSGQIVTDYTDWLTLDLKYLPNLKVQVGPGHWMLNWNIPAQQNSNIHKIHKGRQMSVIWSMNRTLRRWILE